MSLFISSVEKLSFNRSSSNAGFDLLFETLVASTTITLSVVVGLGVVVVVVVLIVTGLIVVLKIIGENAGVVVEVIIKSGISSQFLPLYPEGHSHAKSPSSLVKEIHLPPFWHVFGFFSQ